jgi:hypothetical protein
MSTNQNILTGPTSHPSSTLTGVGRLGRYPGATPGFLDISEISKDDTFPRKPELKDKLPWRYFASLASFWVTLQTNIATSKRGKELKSEQQIGHIKEELVWVIDCLFSKISNISHFLDFKKGNFKGKYIDTNPENLDIADYIQNKEYFPDYGNGRLGRQLRYQVEIGQKFHRIHAHVQFSIVSYAKWLWIKPPEFNEILSECVNELQTKFSGSTIKSISATIRGLPNGVWTSQNYAGKGTHSKTQLQEDLRVPPEVELAMKKGKPLGKKRKLTAEEEAFFN